MPCPPAPGPAGRAHAAEDHHPHRAHTYCPPPTVATRATEHHSMRSAKPTGLRQPCSNPPYLFRRSPPAPGTYVLRTTDCGYPGDRAPFHALCQAHWPEAAVFKPSLLVQGGASGAARPCARCSRKRSRGACGLPAGPRAARGCSKPPFKRFRGPHQSNVRRSRRTLTTATGSPRGGESVRERVNAPATSSIVSPSGGFKLRLTLDDVEAVGAGAGDAGGDLGALLRADPHNPATGPPSASPPAVISLVRTVITRL